MARCCTEGALATMTATASLSDPSSDQEASRVLKRDLSDMAQGMRQPLHDSNLRPLPARPHVLLFQAPWSSFLCVPSHYGSGQGGKGHGFFMCSLGFTQNYVYRTPQRPVVLCACTGAKGPGAARATTAERGHWHSLASAWSEWHRGQGWSLSWRDSCGRTGCPPHHAALCRASALQGACPTPQGMSVSQPL